ncbi:hypothetical protein BH18ACT4_BH18ACT4_07980 [soil metagenome]
MVGQDVGGGEDGAGGVDDVVDEDAAAPVDVADHTPGLDGVDPALDVALVHEGQVGPEVLGEALRDLDPSGVGGDHHEVVGALLAEVGQEDRHGREMIDGLVEEALDLA